MALMDTVVDLASPIIAEHGLTLFDAEQQGPVVKITVDAPGGIDLDALASVTRAISRELDEQDPISSQYTLEVSSPGLERALRTPAHYRWAVGQQVAIKLTAAAAGDGDRRLTGTIQSADDEGAVVALSPATSPEGEPDTRRLAYDEIDKARTVFEWGPAPKPGKASREKRVKSS